jgi:hypothetical protein
MSSSSLVRQLFDGPLDFVGDLHGEIDALRALLGRLGYDADGRHPEGRRLVFLGDLTDRGPDSPAVVDLVRRLVEANRAQCVLGNHDLNLLLGEEKHDNRWFFGKHSSLDNSGVTTPAVLADDIRRNEILRFFRTLPIALERDDVRVVHACWSGTMIDIARPAECAVALHDEFTRRIQEEQRNRPPLDPVERELEQQNRNPVRLLTSGPEQRAARPFEASGKLRHEERVSWWTSYREQPLCIFGHYGFFADQSPPIARAICVDYAVGKRWRERRHSENLLKFRTRLAAFRYPDRTLHFDSDLCL